MKETFKIGEHWKSPSGKVYRVLEMESGRGHTRVAVLESENGRKTRRWYNDVGRWKLEPQERKD